MPNGGGLPLPAYASDGAAGMDVVAAETLTIRPGTRHAVATGFADARGFPVASLLATELAMAQALLDLDDRNFHGWGYRRFVTSLANDGARERPPRALETETERRSRSEARSTRDHDRDRATLSDEASEASEARASAAFRKLLVE